MIILSFSISAIVVIIAAIYLNQFGDVISKKTSLSGAAVGTFLIAGATSLPEVTTSITAVYIDNADIAVGNMLGSNVFNLLIIAVMDVMYRKQRLFQAVSARANIPTATIGLLFMITLIVALIRPGTIELFNIGIEMFVIFVLYFTYVMFTSSSGEQDEDVPEKDYTKQNAIVGFIIAAVVVFISGSVLSISGDRLAQVTGMNASFVGSILIAAATSLPELVAVLAAIRYSNYSIAIGSILGSNLFNIQILALTDVFYRREPILKAVATSNLYTACLGIFMTLVVMYSLLRTNKKQHTWVYTAPSILMVVVYIVVSYMLF
ncbi:sodium:calcium antiporter [Pontibacillus yanchengensis]|uniref:Sodium:calcium antiporter n=2 Tax=Pontibacillus yanchengensis TaxID=462910 RepID=A0ACC7VC13_9BACI|nr:sodium:calcium antiporter [Pontibacillus yanchengensis]MYL35172.1 sodium:calcium antiporter [Pontibacillus yanchengensis]MYL52461.1 sodium:calcium antiporter [Pontibacillus yanchengensis]